MTPPTADAQPLGVDRQAFMARVRQALGRDQTHAQGQSAKAPDAPLVDESIARLAGPEDDLVGMFAQRATTVGLQVQRLQSSALAQTVVAVLREVKAKTVVIGTGWLQFGDAIARQVSEGGFEIIDWQQPGESGGDGGSGGFDRMFDVDAGITEVHGALAETGTLICNCDAGHSRGLSLLPPTHIAVVRASDILPDMIDYWARLKGLPPSEIPSNINFITGPSKTADIEGELVTGVHGPERVHVLLVEDA